MGGTISVSDYSNKFNCLCEIKQNNDNFGIENQRACGFDRLNIQSGQKNEDNKYNKFGRFCSNKNDEGKPHNALTAFNSYNGVKITNQEWQAGPVELDTNHVRIGFDTDNQGTGAGFVINYEIVGLEEEATFDEIHQDLSNQLEDIFQNLAFDQLDL